MDVPSKAIERHLRHVTDVRHVPTRLGTQRHVSRLRTRQARLPSTQGTREGHPQQHSDVERARGGKGTSRAKQCASKSVATLR